MSTLFNVFHSIQNSLFPWLDETFDPLTEKEQRFVQVVSLMDLQKHMTQSLSLPPPNFFACLPKGAW